MTLVKLCLLIHEPIYFLTKTIRLIYLVTSFSRKAALTIKLD